MQEFLIVAGAICGVFLGKMVSTLSIGIFDYSKGEKPVFHAFKTPYKERSIDDMLDDEKARYNNR